MDLLQETGHESKKTFLNHVFSGSEEGKAEILNVVQYAIMGVVPIVVLNKLIQRFIPEADTDKSSLELLAEIFMVMYKYSLHGITPNRQTFILDV
jgi:hypothetical protein